MSSRTKFECGRLAMQLNMKASQTRKSSNQERIAEAMKFAETDNYLRAALNKNTYKFVMGQVRHQKLKSRGRRFTTDEKVFALSLLKQSPRGYRLLKRSFALPSRRTLMALLNKVPFRHGINASIIKALKCDVEHMESLDKCCILMYDEMSINPGLHYNRRDDKIEGFSSFDKKFANHVMVFMIKGLRRKWKQPVAYYFTNSGMGAADLVRLIKEIILKLEGIGLYIMSTVCDQLSTNAKAIKMLLEATERDHLRANMENRMFGFKVNGHEVIPLYDVPHLLKGLRNNLLQYNATFTLNGEKLTASWADIERVYELDVGKDDTKAMKKLTDAHVVKDKIRKMKVKLAAQVFSQSVASVMKILYDNGKYLTYNNCFILI